MMAAFALSLVASSGVLAERISGGSPGLATIAIILVVLLGAALLAGSKSFAHAREGASISVPAQVGVQVFAAVAAVAAVHLVIRFLPRQLTSDLVEAPRQFVNDAVAALATLAFAFALRARSARTRATLALSTIAVVGVYHFSAKYWHVDHASYSGITVQEYVFTQIIATALALLVYDLLSPAPSA